MNVIVFGGCGFIGSHVVDTLLASGHSVTVFSRSKERFRGSHQNVKYVLADFKDRGAIAESLRGHDAVVHAISTTVPGTANLDPISDVSENLIGTIGLLELIRDAGISKIVYLSSGGTVYGAVPRRPVSEEHPLNPINSYGVVKAAIERYLEIFHRSFGLQYVVIRAANPYGKRQGKSGVQGVVASFMRCLQEGRPIEIWGDGSIIRDYLHVSDLAGLCVMALESNACGTFNAGSGRGLSLLQVADVVTEVAGVPVEKKFFPGRQIDVPYSVLDIKKAFETFNWAPTTDFADGVRDTWGWVLESSSES